MDRVNRYLEGAEGRSVEKYLALREKELIERENSLQQRDSEITQHKFEIEARERALIAMERIHSVDNNNNNNNSSSVGGHERDANLVGPGIDIETTYKIDKKKMTLNCSIYLYLQKFLRHVQQPLKSVLVIRHHPCFCLLLLAPARIGT